MNKVTTDILLTNNIHIYATAEAASIKVARVIADEIIKKRSLGQQLVLGLATGNTPKMVYQQLVRMHRDEGLSFKNVISFNLDEYYPLKETHPLSYHSFMNQHLFDHIDIAQSNIHLPHGEWDVARLGDYCKAYDQKIKQHGGIDLQLLGIGRNGHIGFNEPGSAFDSATRLIDLHEQTRTDAAIDFEGIENVPLQAITMGIATITNAKKILLLAIGTRKAEIIKKAFQNEISPEVPATFLRTLPQVSYILDQEAAALVGPLER